MKYMKVAAIAAGTVIALSGAAPAFADSDATSYTGDSPGVVSGNSINIPVHLPINACGDTVSVIGLLNPTWGNACVNN